ncbi:MAG: ribonuclease E/G, partial [Aquiluna sp.]
MAKKKEEPKKPAATQLIFQAPDLPVIAPEPKKPREAKPERKRTTTATKAKKEQPKKKEEKTEDESSTRVEAKRQRRRDSRDSGRRRSTVTESEFLARRESVDRKMIVREVDDRVQVGVLEDGMLVEHYVTESQGGSIIGNVYLGKVQNVLPSMEAAFVDIGRGRNAVLYSGEVDWEAAEAGNQPRRIELALKTGDSVLVQVTKDPVGQKGARLTSQISLPGRFLVYVPGGNMSGISRKLPEGERARLKQILKNALPEDAGVIVRTAAEGATEEQLNHDVQ